MKGGVSSEAEPPTKKQKKVKTHNESEADAAGNGSSEKEGSKELELENKATLTTIVNTLDIISRKFDQVDSRLEAYELDRNRPLMDQKTIDDRESGVKRALDEEFGSVDKDTDIRPLDFLVISPAKATKDDKSTKDDKAAKDPGYGRGCRRTRIVKGEEADKKKKVAQADAALKRKEKAEAKKEAAEDKKKEAEAKKKEAAAKKKVAEAKKKAAELKKKQEAELKKKNKAGSKYKKVTPPRDGVTRCNVQPDVEDSSLADIIDQVVAEQNEFAPESDVDNSELNVTPSSAIYEPLAPVDPVILEKLMQHIKAIPPKPPAPPGKKEVLTTDHESDFYSILIHERLWPEAEYGWLFDNAVLSNFYG
ncbi:unnamed protein product [Brassica oleracea]